MIILGPGSLYTSVMPNLLIKGIKDAVLRSRAIKVYICNVMTEAGETERYFASDHVRAIIKHTAPGIIDYCVANVTSIPKHLYEKYKQQEQYPVKIDQKDEEWFRREKIKLIKAHIASTTEFVRHDSVRLTNAIMNIFNASKSSET